MKYRFFEVVKVRKHSPSPRYTVGEIIVVDVFEDTELVLMRLRYLYKLKEVNHKGGSEDV